MVEVSSHRFFKVHHDDLIGSIYRSEKPPSASFADALKKRIASLHGSQASPIMKMMYRCDISLPTLRCVIPVELTVTWPPFEGMA